VQPCMEGGVYMQTDGRTQTRTLVAVPDDLVQQLKLQRSAGTSRFGVGSSSSAVVAISPHVAHRLASSLEQSKLRGRDFRSTMYQATHCLPVRPQS
jgi:hypothetical protein